MHEDLGYSLAMLESAHKERSSISVLVVGRELAVAPSRFPSPVRLSRGAIIK